MEVMGRRGLVETVMRPGDPQMLVSTLSGTRRGEFTGAINQRGALREALAQQKVLFLDEIQNINEHGQRVLLPLLELPVRRFGGLTTAVQTLGEPLHIILGTNAPVTGSAWQRHFRDDLWFRMSALQVHLPPLFQRGREAIYRYMADMLEARGCPPPEDVLDVAALSRLTEHTWPGNLRSLERFCSEIAYLYGKKQDRLGPTELPSFEAVDGGLPDVATSPSPASLPTHSSSGAARPGPPGANAQVDEVLRALEESDWVQAQAARTLGISKFALHRLLKRHDLLDRVRRQKYGAS